MEHFDMPNELRNYREWLFETPIALIDFFIGGFLPATMPFITHINTTRLPAGLQGEYAEHVIWLIIGVIASAVYRNLYRIPRRVKEDTAHLRNDVVRAFYAGFYALSAGDALREKFQSLDKSLADGKIPAGIRDIVFGFLAKAAAHVGESGLAMVDVEVSEYVHLLQRLFLIQNQVVRATCVVRPYWFISPFVKDVTPAPITKAGHLLGFTNYQSNMRPRRLAVFDERTILDILLTGFIDREVLKKCPHLRRTITPKGRAAKATGNPGQVPEIRWFEEDANKGVELWYTRVRHEGRNVLSALEDRVFMQPDSNAARIDIRFSFTTLASGILWLRWGDNAQDFKDFVDERDETATLVDESGKKHNVYRHFWALNRNCLLGSLNFQTSAIRAAMEEYLVAVLKWHVNSKLPDDGTLRFADGRRKAQDHFQTTMLSDDVLPVVNTALDQLLTEIRDGKSVAAIYRELADHYRENGEPEVAYVVSYDRSHPDVPVIAVQWKETWQSVCAKT